MSVWASVAPRSEGIVLNQGGQPLGNGADICSTPWGGALEVGAQGVPQHCSPEPGATERCLISCPLSPASSEAVLGQGGERGRKGAAANQNKWALCQERCKNQEACQRSPLGYKAQKKKAEGIG